MKHFFTLSLLLTVLFGSRVVRAQETETTFDPAGKIEVITTEMQSKSDLFPEVKDFKEARLFILPDSSYTLDISSDVAGKITHTRKPLTKEERLALFHKLAVVLEFSDPGLLTDQSGRSSFLLGMASLSLLVYGPSVAVLSGGDGGSATGMWLISAGAGYLLPAMMTSGSKVTQAQSTLAISSGYQGYAAGLTFGAMTNADPTGIIALGMISSLTDLSVMYTLAGSEDMTEAKASLIAQGGLNGMLDGFAVGGLLDNSSEFSSGKEAGILLGHVGGYIVANAIANGENYTAGDATGINLLSSLGFWAGVANTSAIGNSKLVLEDQSALAAGLIGNAAGYYFGAKLLRHYALTGTQGTYLQLGTYGGALVGFGVGILADSKFEHPMVWSILSTLGAIGGFAAVLGSMQRAELNSGKSGVSFNVNPAGLLGALTQSSKTNNPIVGMQYAW